MRLLALLLVISSVTKAQTTFNSTYEYQAGLTLSRFLLDDVRMLGNPLHYSLPLAGSFKIHLNHRNAVYVLGSADTRFTTLRFQERSASYRHNAKEYLFGFGYERTALAKWRVNPLFGIHTVYVNRAYSKAIPQPCTNLFRCRSYVGLGPDIGLRFIISRRFVVESHLGMTAGKRLQEPYPQPFLQSLYFDVPRGISLEAHYRFGKRNGS